MSILFIRVSSVQKALWMSKNLPPPIVILSEPKDLVIREYPARKETIVFKIDVPKSGLNR